MKKKVIKKIAKLISKEIIKSNNSDNIFVIKGFKKPDTGP
jgi:hypothetical protein